MFAGDVFKDWLDLDITTHQTQKLSCEISSLVVALSNEIS